MFLHGIASPLYRSIKDEALIRRYWTTGDNHLIAELFHRYAQSLHRLCRRRLQDDEISRDIVMRTFEKCLSAPPPPGIQSVGRWLTTLARNACIDYLRLLEHRTEQQQMLARFQEDRVHAPDDDHPEGYPSLPLSQAMGRLKKEQRTCIDLFFFQQKTYEQIAQCTSYSVPEIKSHLQNGKRRLRILLDQPEKKNSKKNKQKGKRETS